MACYSLKQLANARKLSAECVNTQPLFIPVGRCRPETFNQALERIMATSISQGMTYEEAFNQLRPSYDGDYDGDEYFDDYDFEDDDFSQSEYATYENDSLNITSASPSIDSKSPSINTSATKEDTTSSDVDSANKMDGVDDSNESALAEHS